jgi:predicted secreted Zn-dependent protease
MFLAAAFGVYWLANRPLAVEPAVDPSTISESNAATVADAIRGIPNIAISYYSIQATDEAGIRKELYLKGPRTEGERFGALTEWYFSWHWEPGLDGSCGTGNASVMFSAAITLHDSPHPS